MKVGILDSGMGNIRSVLNAFLFLLADVVIVRKPEDIASIDAIVLPGVGAFGRGMARLRQAEFIGPLRQAVLEQKKYFLGICLGMQLLATKSFEGGEFEGLGWIPGEVHRIPHADLGHELRIPHVGWNDVRLIREDGLYKKLELPSCFYFVHSYALYPQDDAVISGETVYGAPFVASIERENIMATQYHPEKSHRAGLLVIRNWLSLVEEACSSTVSFPSYS